LRFATFKAVFESLLIIDWLAGAEARSATAVDDRWWSLLTEVAQGCVNGQAIDPEHFGHRFLQIERESITGCLLAALPLLLVNVDSHGHRRDHICQWARQMGLSKATTTAIDEFFAYLSRVHQTNDALAAKPKGISRLQVIEDIAFTNPSLAGAHQVLALGQQQLWLSLQLARQKHWSKADLALVAVLAAIAGGGCAIPLVLKQAAWETQRHKSQSNSAGEGGANIDHWSLNQLSRGLYYRWSGAHPNAVAVEDKVNSSFVVTV
jgi:hypothetical protein